VPGSLATIPILAGRARSTARARKQRAASPALWHWVVVAVALVAAATALVGAAFSGSTARLPDGVRIAGIDVGGLRPGEARSLLERRSDALQNVPATFVVEGRRWRISPRRLGVEADWAAAVDSARRQGEGFGPVRGLRRVKVRVFGADVSPPARVYVPALEYQLQQLAEEIDRPRRESAIVLNGLKPVLVPGRPGYRLRREAAASTIVGALASLSRVPTPLPVRVIAPSVTADELRPALTQARRALAGPMWLQLGDRRWRLRPRGIAKLLSLPHDGSTKVEIGGPGANAFFTRFTKRVGRSAVDANFRIMGGGVVEVVPHRTGLGIDTAATSAQIRRAALSPTARVARVVVVGAQPQLTTAEARAMGITRVLAGYTTAYSGTADRINNLQRAVGLIDGALIPPGGTFSLNERVGARTVERGFRVAPVIIGGEYKEDVGGGVSQVATTVFNAAWEAGVKIVERNPHSLYISRYQLGRDATVNYPDLDLKFRNDTPKWLRVFGWSGSSGITIAIAGAPTGRRVVSKAGELTVTGPVPIKRVVDPTLPVGTKVVEEEGTQPTVVVVTRTVYRANGTVLYDETWRTAYRGEKRVVRVGTKKPEPKPTETSTTTTSTTTTPTTTGKKPPPPPPPAPPPAP
jgi:vancomycin resistance protein YoaR